MCVAKRKSFKIAAIMTLQREQFLGIRLIIIIIILRLPQPNPFDTPFATVFKWPMYSHLQHRVQLFTAKAVF